MNRNDMNGYESPINVYEIATQMAREYDEQLGECVWKAVKQSGVSVDKDELLAALMYDRHQYEKGYRDGYENGKNQWIPCSERMPENETEVLIFCPDLCDRIKKAMFIEDGFYEERTDLIVKPGEYCTHWMPLPEPPKEVQNVERN